MYVFPQHSPWGTPDDENFCSCCKASSKDKASASDRPRTTSDEQGTD